MVVLSLSRLDRIVKVEDKKSVAIEIAIPRSCWVVPTSGFWPSTLHVTLSDSLLNKHWKATLEESSWLALNVSGWSSVCVHVREYPHTESSSLYNTSFYSSTMWYIWLCETYYVYMYIATHRAYQLQANSRTNTDGWLLGSAATYSRRKYEFVTSRRSGYFSICSY